MSDKASIDFKMPQALSEDQVQNELKKMVSFIRQEALEKAREIHIKADEEFQVLKARLIQQDKAKIDTQYDLKCKEALRKQQILKSQSTNQARIQLLNAQDKLVDDFFDGLRKASANIESNKEAYKQFLKDLIVASIFKVSESEFEVQFREKDRDFADDICKQAEEEANKSLDRDIRISIDKNKYIERYGILNFYIFPERQHNTNRYNFTLVLEV